jgi:hypothetical protein
MENIKSFISYLEDSKIYESTEMSPSGLESENELNTDFINKKSKIHKTWIENYLIPMGSFKSYDEKNQKYKSVLTSAKSWLSSPSGISTKSQNGRYHNWTNGEIVFIIYWDKKNTQTNRDAYPLRASVYDLIKGVK